MLLKCIYVVMVMLSLHVLLILVVSFMLLGFVAWLTKITWRTHKHTWIHMYTIFPWLECAVGYTVPSNSLLDKVAYQLLWMCRFGFRLQDRIPFCCFFFCLNSKSGESSIEGSHQWKAKVTLWERKTTTELTCSSGFGINTFLSSSIQCEPSDTVQSLNTAPLRATCILYSHTYPHVLSYIQLWFMILHC